MLYKKVPLDEKEPLVLMKTIIRLGGESGLRGISINLKEEDAAASETASYGEGQAEATQTGGGEEAAQPPPEQSAGEVIQQPVSQEERVFPVYLEMSFEGSFPQILSFLNKLEHFERLIKVEGVLIERKKEILPYQKVSLDLTTYTFLK